MKHATIALIILLIFSACQEKKLDGKWIEINENNSPRILTFEGDKLTIEYLNTCDTFRFNINKEYFTRSSSIDTVSARILWTGDSIFSWDSIFFFKKLLSNSLADSLFIFPKVNITLPIAKGIMLRSRPYFDKSYEYYIETDNDSIKIKYKGTIIKNELDLVQSVDARRNIHEHYNSGNIIFADKDCKYKHISKVKYLFQYCKELKITYAVRKDKSKLFNNLSGISLRMPPLSYYDEKKIGQLLQEQLMLKDKDNKYSEIIEQSLSEELMLPPSPPSFYEVEQDRKTLVEVYNDSLFLNRQAVNTQVYLSKIKESLKNDKRRILFYYIDGEATYDNYIEFLDKTIDIFYELRNELALSNYNMDFVALNDSLQNEVRRSIPLSIVEISENDLIFPE